MKVNEFLLEKFKDMGFDKQEVNEEISKMNLTSLEKVDLILEIQEKYNVMVELKELENMSMTSLQEYISGRI